MSMTSAVSAWRWRRVLRSLDRRWRRRLEADLAGATSRERADLPALLDRYDDADTAVLREILWSQSQSQSQGRQDAAQRRRRAAAGFAAPLT
jgi:hypothetical protein